MPARSYRAAPADSDEGESGQRVLAPESGAAALAARQRQQAAGAILALDLGGKLRCGIGK